MNSHNKRIAKSGADVHFIIFSPLVILRSSLRNSYHLLYLTSSINL